MEEPNSAKIENAGTPVPLEQLVIKSCADRDLILAAIDLAFEAGTWYGQVELEEHMDRAQYSQVALEAIMTRKTAAPCDIPSEGRTVRYNLRSDKWREGVKKSADEYKQKAINFIFSNLEVL